MNGIALTTSGQDREQWLQEENRYHHNYHWWSLRSNYISSSHLNSGYFTIGCTNEVSSCHDSSYVETAENSKETVDENNYHIKWCNKPYTCAVPCVAEDTDLLEEQPW